jgi:TolB-like protein
MRSLALVPIFALIACAGGCGETKVTATGNQVEAYRSGNWNDSMSVATANEMIASVTASKRINEWRKVNNRLPLIQPGTLVNSTGDDIATTIIMEKLMDAMLASEQFRVLSNKTSAQETRAELTEQEKFAAAPKQMSKEAAADFMLNGRIVVQNDQAGNQNNKMYQVTLDLADVQSREIWWKQTFERRLEVENPQRRF